MKLPKHRMLLICCLIISSVVLAQTPKGLTMEEYQKARTFLIKDFDNDTYVKFDNNAYVLDKNETEKPIFITGDDQLKKRIDLYTLIRRSDNSSIGRMIYYTNENGKLYVACLPNVSADKKVWDTYFEDIHASEREEKNYALKMTYILSKELSQQRYKATLKGAEVDRSEAGTYGTDICFPGDEQVTMAGGGSLPLRDISAGDQIVSIDPVTRQATIVRVKQLITHTAQDYAVTTLGLYSVTESAQAQGLLVQQYSRTVKATPNHPALTTAGEKNFGAVNIGDEVLGQETDGTIRRYTVWNIRQAAGGLQPVYNLETESGETLVLNGLILLQKPRRQAVR